MTDGAHQECLAGELPGSVPPITLRLPASYRGVAPGGTSGRPNSFPTSFWLRPGTAARLAAVGPPGAAPDPTPEVFTLVPPDDRLDARGRALEDLLRRGRPPRERDTPALPRPPSGEQLVFRRRPDGRVEADGFPDEAEVCEALVARLDPRVVRLERGRLYVEAANGAAVYAPVGPSPRPGCRRYGRLYLRPVGG